MYPVDALVMKSKFLKYILKKPDALIWSFLCAVLFFTYNYLYLFSLTAPSDPLQYVKPSLNPEFGFPYLDRVILWLWIRLISVMPLNPEEIGGVATLLASSLTLFLVSWFLARRFNLITSALFVGFYVMSPTVLGIASYTYPMQILTLVLALTLILMSVAPTFNMSLLIGGFGALLLVLCKVQGGSFFVFLFLYGTVVYKNVTDFFIGGMNALLGVTLAMASVLLILFSLDGIDSTLRLFSYYFSATAEPQFSGRAEGGLPDFYSYLLEPTAILALLGVLLLRVNIERKTLQLWSLAGLCQLLGLMAIYIITQRGGPVISNYFLDVYVVGLMCISVLIGTGFNFIKRQMLCSVIFLTVVSFYLLHLTNLPQNSLMFYSPHHLIQGFNLIVLGMVFWAVIFMLIMALFFNKTKFFLLFFIFMVVFVFMRSDEGVKDSKARATYNSVYHEVSLFLKGRDYVNKKVWVSMELNGEDSERSNIRLKDIYNTFYKNDNNNYIFGSAEPENYDIIISNINEIYRRFGIDPDLFVKSSDTLSINKKTRLDEEIPLKDINSFTDLDFKLGGLRGTGAIKKIIVDTAYSLELVVDTKSKSLVQLDLSDGRLEPVDVGRILFISSDTVNTESGLVVSLYGQYILDGKWTRKTFQVNSITGPIGLSLAIPEGAKEISYGWIVSAENDNPTIKGMSVKLPNIRYFVVDNGKNKFGLNIGQVWEMESR